MKFVLKSLLKIVIRLWSYIYTYSFSQWLVGKRDMIYTLWICNFMDKIGKNSSIQYPCFLEGSGVKRISIGDNTCIQSHAVLGCRNKYKTCDLTHQIIIGNNCNFGAYNHISACNKIIIGDGLLTGRYVIINHNSHGSMCLAEANVPPAQRKLSSKGEIVIGKNVWIGDKAAVLSGVHIGDNVVIAANAVVTKDIPSNCVVAGVPAKVVKQMI